MPWGPSNLEKRGVAVVVKEKARVGVWSRVWSHIGHHVACLDLTMFRFRFQQDHNNLNESLSYSSGRTKLLPSAHLPSLSDLKKWDAAPPQIRKSHLSFVMDVYIQVLYWAGEFMLVYRLFRDLHPSGRKPLLRYKAPEPQRPTAAFNRRASLQPIPAKL